MNTPTYSVTITHLTAGWSYASTQGTEPPDEARSVLADPLTYDWGFEGEQIPGPLAPSVVTFEVWSRTAADDPAPQRGDLLTVLVRLTTDGPVLLNQTMRVTQVITDLNADDPDWPVRTVVTLADLLADLNATPTVEPTQTYSWYYRRRMAALGAVAGRSIGCPDTWPDDVVFTGPDYIGVWSIFWPQVTAADFLASALASYHVGGISHSVCPLYADDYPAGYEPVQGAPWNPSAPTYPDPDTAIRYLITPADRSTATTAVLEAAWCDVPARARRGREHAPNTLDIGGVEQIYDPYNGYTGVLERNGKDTRSSTDAAVHGPVTRKVDTQLVMRSFYAADAQQTVLVPTQTAAINAAAAPFLADPTALASSWVFDDIEVRAIDMTTEQAAAVLPRLVPSYPGTGGDGQVVRHVTVTGLAPAVQLPGFPAIAGFITHGRLTIAEGELRFTLTTTPGQPT